MQIIFLTFIFLLFSPISFGKDLLILSSVGGVYNVNNHFTDLQKNGIKNLKHTQIINNIDKDKYEVVCINYYSKVFGSMNHKNCDNIIEYNSNILDWLFLTVDSLIDYDTTEHLMINKLTDYFYITRPLFFEYSLSSLIKDASFKNIMVITNNIHREHLIIEKIRRKFPNKKISIKIKDYNLEKITKKNENTQLFISDYELKNDLVLKNNLTKTIDFDFLTILSEQNHDELISSKIVNWNNVIKKNNKIKESYIKNLK